MSKTTGAAPNHRGSKQADVFFQMSSLFRLQVKTADRGELGGAFQAIEQILSHGEYFDERLNKYAVALRRRIANMLEISHKEPQPVLQHPFYAREVPRAYISAKVASLRHLLALTEQNEGVISEVLDTVSQLCGEDPSGLLGMLAIEPRLLEDDPLAVECWQSIKDVCLKCLRSEEIDSAIKSDALSVLCTRANEVTHDLQHLLPLICADPDLVDQLTAFLLSRVVMEPIWHERLHACLDAVEGVVDQQTYDWLRTILDVPPAVQSQYIVRDEADATAHIHNLVAETWVHVGLERWQSFGIAVRRHSSGTSRLRREDVEEGLRNARFATTVFLPGLAGIQHFAARRLIPTERRTIREAIIQGVRSVKLLQVALKSMSEIGEENSQEIERAVIKHWNDLTTCTVKSASAIRLLGSADQIGTEPSVIESALPKLFSAPYPLMEESARRGLQMQELEIIGDKEVFVKDAVIVPVARDLISDVFRILLEDMSRYAGTGKRTCRLQLISPGKHSELRIELRNTIGSSDLHGTGYGSSVLKAHAARGGFELSSDRDGDWFVTRITIPGAIRVAVRIPRT